MSDVSRETDSFTRNIEQQIAMRKAGRRGLVRHGGTLCSKCYSEPPMKGQRYCHECHNEASRASYHRKQAELKRLRAEHGEGATNG